MKKLPSHAFCWIVLPLAITVPLAQATPSYGYSRDDAAPLCKLLIGALVMTTISKTEATTVPYAWEKTFGGMNHDVGRGLTVTDGDHYLTTGFTESYGWGKKNLWILAWDDNGDIQWNEVVGAGDDDEGDAMVVTANDSLVVAAHTTTDDHEYIWLVKYRANRTLTWSKMIESSRKNRVYSMTLMGHDDCMLTGMTENEGLRASLLIHINGTGNLVRAQIFNISREDYSRSVMTNAQGEILLAGDTLHGGRKNIFVIRLHNMTDFQWGQIIGGNFTGIGTSMIAMPDDGFVLVGYLSHNSSVQGDLLVARYNATNDLTWAKTFGESNINVSHARGAHALYTDEGDIVLYWGMIEHGLSSKHIAVAKLNAMGDPQWAKMLSIGTYSTAYSVAVNSIGEIIITGKVLNTTAENDLLLAKLLSNGTGCGTFFPLNATDVTSSLPRRDITSLAMRPLNITIENITLNVSHITPHETILCSHVDTPSTTLSQISTRSPTDDSGEEETNPALDIAIAFLSIVATVSTTVLIYCILTKVSKASRARRLRKEAEARAIKEMEGGDGQLAYRFNKKKTLMFDTMQE